MFPHLIVLTFEWLAILGVGGVAAGGLYWGSKELRFRATVSDRKRGLVEAEAEDIGHQLAVKRFQNKQQLLALTTGRVDEVPEVPERTEKVEVEAVDVQDVSPRVSGQFQPSEEAAFVPIR